VFSHALIERYRSWLPVNDATPVVTLGEGSTPLIGADGLLGDGRRLWLKLESHNPTGSFKDRGMTVAVSLAKQRGARLVICASTGNTSASAAAYAARAGLAAAVVVPAGAVAAGKLAQAIAHGATLIAVHGNFDQALAAVRAVAQQHPAVALVNSVNPDRIAGQKTAAWEIIDDLGAVPDYVALPVGNAGNITAYHAGFLAYRQAGLISRLPRLLGCQAEGAAPLVRGEWVDRPETVATAIRIGHPASAPTARQAVRETGGRFLAVTDTEIMAAHDRLARKVGVFVEPASAAAVAGLVKAEEAGWLEPEAVVVAVLTGHGLKDPDAVLRRQQEPHRTVEPADVAAVVERLISA
jgi:threonine synthase